MRTFLANTSRMVAPRPLCLLLLGLLVGLSANPAHAGEKGKHKAKILYVMRGLSGSGKSTLAHSLGKGGAVFSTDEFSPSSTKVTNAKSIYNAIKGGVSPLVIDNMHIEAWTAKPVVVDALKHGYQVEIREPGTPWRFDAQELVRRSPHNVPLESIQRDLKQYGHVTTVKDILSSYAAKELPFSSVERIFDRLNRARVKAGLIPLKNRGEAHITIISPPEMVRLKQHLTPEQIETATATAQKVSFQIIGLGRHSAAIPESSGGAPAEAFFLVVKSKAILEMRQRIYDEFVAHGGSPDAFHPMDQRLHITVGFTHRDLYASDGARKDSSSIDPEYQTFLR